MALDLQELRVMSLVDLDLKVEELKKQLLTLRVQHHTGKLEKNHELQLLKREIARVKTVQSELRNESKKGAKS
jgi:large subunit ribosomal protein L29